MNIEQSTISRLIRDLEVRLGASMFERSPCGVRLTAAGESFLESARPAVAHLETATAAAQEIGRVQAATLHVGVQGAVMRGVLEDLLRRAAADPRTCRIVLHEATSTEHLALLEPGRLDIAFVAADPAGTRLRSAVLWRERLVVALPVGHRLSSRSTIGWRDLTEIPLIFPDAGGLQLEVLAVKRMGATAVVSRQAVGRETLLFLVALGQGLTVLPAPQCQASVPGVIFRPLQREVISFRAVWSPRNEKKALARLLRLAGIDEGAPASS